MITDESDIGPALADLAGTVGEGPLPLPAMTQQQKLAAALLKAGISTSAAAWTAPVMRPSRLLPCSVGSSPAICVASISYSGERPRTSRSANRR